MGNGVRFPTGEFGRRAAEQLSRQLTPVTPSGSNLVASYQSSDLDQSYVPPTVLLVVWADPDQDTEHKILDYSGRYRCQLFNQPVWSGDPADPLKGPDDNVTADTSVRYQPKPQEILVEHQVVAATVVGFTPDDDDHPDDSTKPLYYGLSAEPLEIVHISFVDEPSGEDEDPTLADSCLVQGIIQDASPNDACLRLANRDGGDCYVCNMTTDLSSSTGHQIQPVLDQYYWARCIGTIEPEGFDRLPLYIIQGDVQQFGYLFGSDDNYNISNDPDAHDTLIALDLTTIYGSPLVKPGSHKFQVKQTGIYRAAATIGFTVAISTPGSGPITPIAVSIDTTGFTDPDAISVANQINTQVNATVNDLVSQLGAFLWLPIKVFGSIDVGVDGATGPAVMAKVSGFYNAATGLSAGQYEMTLVWQGKLTADDVIELRASTDGPDYGFVLGWDTFMEVEYLGPAFAP